MIHQIKKTVIRMSFEEVLDQLKKELNKAGFEAGNATGFRQSDGNDMGYEVKKYRILTVYHPFLYNEMMRISPFEGIVLPCFISVTEIYPGEVALVPFNSTEMIAREIQSSSLQGLATEITGKLTDAIHALEKQQTGTPDLVTSWE